jgi:nickel and cobalt resistance protein CnrR
MRKLIVVLLTLALSAGVALAQPADRPLRRGNGPAMAGRGAMMEKLNLTEEQQSQMRKLKVEFQKKQIQNQARIRVARLDLHQLLSADKPDRGTIEKAIKEISAMQTEAKLNHLDHMFAVRGILNPEQQKIWKEQRMHRGGMRHERMRMLHRDNMGQHGDNVPFPEFDMPPPGADFGNLMDLSEDIEAEVEIVE